MCPAKTGNEDTKAKRELSLNRFGLHFFQHDPQWANPHDTEDRSDRVVAVRALVSDDNRADALFALKQPMPKLTEYVETAANEYFRESGSVELDAVWLAEFFQDSGVLDEYPRQDVVAFHALVQKALTLSATLAAKQAGHEIGKMTQAKKRR